MSDQPAVFKQIPHCIHYLFESPPILQNEPANDYYRLLAECIHHYEPEDIISWIYLKDFVDYAWEVVRMRRMRSPLLETERKRAISIVVSKIQSHLKTEPVIDAETAAASWNTDAETRRVVGQMLRRSGLTEGAVDAQMYVRSARTMEEMAQMEDFLATRRDAAAVQLESRKAMVKTERRKPLEAIDLKAERTS
jgi:hypothetical protein